MAYPTYIINKGINRPIEFRGLKAQYIYYLAIGLAILLVAFSALYIAGVPVYFCAALIATAGSGLFAGVYHYSHKYGEHGLMKAISFKQVPVSMRCHSRKIFSELVTKIK
jgi:hypothetical protein